ncbi:mitogen-activated kinase kinase kinase 12-like protein [Labeo rohita]|uniref:Mitogen-activated kinase kinase kinase 12-like protein n=1 Tax=Labeo rohita TaxID=84645 RepID=A0A498NDX7_LABRO|nr:mitogen-activated kinase kinase kinase 12-like protein [Labeo rohita]
MAEQRARVEPAGQVKLRATRAGLKTYMEQEQEITTEKQTEQTEQKTSTTEQKTTTAEQTEQKTTRAGKKTTMAEQTKQRPMAETRTWGKLRHKRQTVHLRQQGQRQGTQKVHQ